MADIPAKEVLENLYLSEKMSMKNIGDMFGISRITVSKWLKNYGIPTKNKNEIYEAKLISEDELHQLYNIQGKSLKQIAERYDVSKKTVVNYMERYGMRRRPKSFHVYDHSIVRKKRGPNKKPKYRMKPVKDKAHRAVAKLTTDEGFKAIMDVIGL